MLLQLQKIILMFIGFSTLIQCGQDAADRSMDRRPNVWGSNFYGKADNPTLCANHAFQVAKDQVIDMGLIPQGGIDAEIKLTANADLDLMLFDPSSQKQIIGWPQGILSSSGECSTQYEGIPIKYSGFWGDGISRGHEYITIRGATNKPLQLKIFGFEGGTAQLSCSWTASGTPETPPPPQCPPPSIVFQWNQVSTSISAPSVFGAKMAFDNKRQRLVLYEAALSKGNTWEFDGRQWTLVAHADHGPTPRRKGTALAYDEARGKVVLFGGLKEADWYLDDIWEWDGKAWQMVPPEGNSPPRRAYHAMAYNSHRQRIMLYGGKNNAGKLNDAWEWDGLRWIELRPTFVADARSEHAMAYDASRKKMVVFGGKGKGEPGPTLSSVMEWDGQSWHWPEVKGPAARWGSSMVYDSAHSRILVFGGMRVHWVTNLKVWYYVTQDLWALDGQGWKEIKIEGDLPPARQNCAAAYDSIRKKMMIFGGENLNPGATVYPQPLEPNLWEFGMVPLPNHAPSLSLIPSATKLYVGETLSVKLQAVDADGHSLRATVSPHPPGSILDGLSFRWTPGKDQIGKHTFEFEVSDGCLSDKKSLTIEVANPNYASLPLGKISLRGVVEMYYTCKHYYPGDNGTEVMDTTAQATCMVIGYNPGKVTLDCSTLIGTLNHSEVYFMTLKSQAVLGQDQSFITDAPNWPRSIIKGKIYGSPQSSMLQVSQIKGSFIDSSETICTNAYSVPLKPYP